MNTILRNWKTSLGGVIVGIMAFLMGVPAFLSALQAWGSHQPVDWRSVIVSIALAAGSAALLAAKDGSNHSTQAEVTQASVNANK